ncbi:MAG: hypothetical protein JWL71_166 [Acidobacteria bacterium]|nr:hypothetical protein [Acidobacteriota bacterium]
MRDYRDPHHHGGTPAPVNRPQLLKRPTGPVHCRDRARTVGGCQRNADEAIEPPRHVTGAKNGAGARERRVVRCSAHLAPPALPICTSSTEPAAMYRSVVSVNGAPALIGRPR